MYRTSGQLSVDKIQVAQETKLSSLYFSFPKTLPEIFEVAEKVSMAHAYIHRLIDVALYIFSINTSLQNQDHLFLCDAAFQKVSRLSTLNK